MWRRVSGGSSPALVLASAAILYLWALGARPLYAPDEGRYALVGREMLESGDWVVPTLGGLPYLDKPPLLYWCEAAGMAVLGKNDFGARFVIACVALLGVWLTWRLGCDLLGRGRGLIAASIVACAGLWAGLARVLLTDMLLSVAILGAFLGFWRAWRGRNGAIGMWIALAFSFLAKGPVGPALFLFAAFPFWCLAKPRPSLWAFRPVVGPLLCAAIALPWSIAVERRFPGYLHFFFFHENLKGLGSKEVHHGQPFYYGFVAVLGGFLPWSVFLPHAVARAVAAIRRRGVSADPALLLPLLWAGTIMAVFTVSVSKLTPYYLPMFPALAILVARMFSPATAPRRMAGWTLAALAAAFPVAAAGMAAFDARVPLFGWMSLAAIIAAATFAAGARLLLRGRSSLAFQLLLAGVALAAIPGYRAVEPFDSLRSSKSLLLRNAALLRSCDAILSDRGPVGQPEWYLRVPVIYMGDQHDFMSARLFAPGRLHSMGWEDAPRFLDGHPRTVLLSVARKKDDLARSYPDFRIIDEDQGNLLLASPAVR